MRRADHLPSFVPLVAPLLAPPCPRATRRKRGHTCARVAATSLLEPIHTLPAFLNQLVVSCGIGLAGIAGAKATEHARALTAGDRQAAHMDAMALEIDSVRRRRELAEGGGERDWNDVSVDRVSNVVVVPELVPELESHDDLEAFDKLLMDAPAAERFRRGERRVAKLWKSLPGPAEFEDEEEGEGLDDGMQKGL